MLFGMRLLAHEGRKYQHCRHYHVCRCTNIMWTVSKYNFVGQALWHFEL